MSFLSLYQLNWRILPQICTMSTEPTKGSGLFFEFAWGLNPAQRYLFDSSIGRTPICFYLSHQDTEEARELYSVFTQVTHEDVLRARARKSAKYAYRIDGVHGSLVDSVPLVPFQKKLLSTPAPAAPAPPPVAPPRKKVEFAVLVETQCTRESLKTKLSSRVSGNSEAAAGDEDESPPTFAEDLRIATIDLRCKRKASSLSDALFHGLYS